MERQLFPDNTNLSSSDKFDNCQGDETIIAQHKIQEYVDGEKKLYSNLLVFLENSESSDSNDDFQKLISNINHIQDKESGENFEHFLRLITDISNNIHRDDSFFKKIFQILKYYQEQIKKTFTNIEIYNIFQRNKLILLFLFENKILTIDDKIYLEMMDKREANHSGYCHFFYPEIEEYAGEDKIQSIKDELLSKDPDILNYLQERRKIGQNDSYISKLIREDSVEEFITYINKSNISLESQIMPSLFETNLFLIENEPTLIEYSAFFGSIQIFQYLIAQNVELEPSIWLYAIHSRNPELFEMLEKKKIQPPNDGFKSEQDEDDEEDNVINYDACFIESIKCHHNEMADYIFENLIATKYDVSKQREKFLSNILHYHNYKYFPFKFNMGYDLYYLSCFNYQTIIDLFIKSREKEIDSMIIDKSAEFSANLRHAAENCNIEVIYYLLSKQTKIADNYFDNVKKLNKIAIPPSIVSIENDAFKDCVDLKQISIPSSVTSIGNNSFSNCSKLTQISIPSSVTSIGNNSFSNCSKLTQISIPSSVISIGNEAFGKCFELIQITIPSSVTSIANNLFSGCIKLSQITIPTSVVSIGDNAFSNCSLTEINIPTSVTSIGEKAFSCCTELVQVTIPSSVTSIGQSAFHLCKNLTKAVILASITSIPNDIFKDCKKLESVIISSSVTSIGDNAFSDCSNLAQITLPSSLTSIGKYSFDSCDSLETIVIPSSVTSIGNGAFYECSSLTEIEIPHSITSIKKFAFSGCSSLAQISIPSSITFIEDFVFRNCKSLTEFSINSSVTSIGKGAFSGCSSLTKVLIPDSVTSINDYAFCDCSSLTEISIPDSVSLIKKGVFSGCSSLTKIEIPSSVTSIGSCAFYKCSSLTQFSIPSMITSIESCLFYKCESLEKVGIPSSVTKIGIMSFYGCSSLVDLSIPESVTDIGAFAFLECSSLKSVKPSLTEMAPFVNIDDYEIKELIRDNVFSKVFRVVNKNTGEEFALRCYREDDIRNVDFILDPVAISTIPGTVKVHGFRFPLSDEERTRVETLEIDVVHAGRHIKVDLTGYIVITEFMKYNNVREIITQYLKDKEVNWKMNPTIRSKIIFGVASIMKRIHEQNVIYRNLKIESVFLDENFEPCINCFAYSTFNSNPNNLTMAACAAYCMAPEMFQYGEDTYTSAVDVYSYAILLYVMFSNAIKFDDLKPIRSPHQYMMRIGSGERLKRPKDIPDHYWELIQRCWQNDPDNRPTFAEITNLLKDDKYALEEFGVKTNLEQLHEYQQRIDKV